MILWHRVWSGHSLANILTWAKSDEGIKASRNLEGPVTSFKACSMIYIRANQRCKVVYVLPFQHPLVLLSHCSICSALIP